MTTLKPRSDTNRCDIFANDDGQVWIVRPDLNIFIETSDLHSGANVICRELHPACSDGMAYCAHRSGDASRFIVIRKNGWFRIVSDLELDNDAEEYPLHGDCQGGDHYFAQGEVFYILFKDKKIYRRVTNLNSAADLADLELNEYAQNGLYYWATRNKQYFVSKSDDNSIGYCESDDLHGFKHVKQNLSFAPSLMALLPGGIARKWGEMSLNKDLIHRNTNTTDHEIDYTFEVEIATGANKTKTQEITKHWDVKASLSVELEYLMVKSQVSLEAEFGGSQTETTTNEWHEERKEKQSFHVQIPAGEQLNVYQEVVRSGGEDVLRRESYGFETISLQLAAGKREAQTQSSQKLKKIVPFRIAEPVS